MARIVIQLCFAFVFAVFAFTQSRSASHPRRTLANESSAPFVEWNESDCAIREDPQGLRISGNFPSTSYFLSHNTCIDTRCLQLDADIGALLDSVFARSISCFTKLAGRDLKDSVAKALRGETVEPEALEKIRNSLPARTAVSLALLRSLDPHFADYFRDDQQWLSLGPDGAVVNAGSEEILASLRKSNPVRIHCFPSGTNFSYLRQSHGKTIATPVKVKFSFSLGAEAGPPGTGPWPEIELDTVGFMLNRDAKDAIPSILLHEMMHLLGYKHESDSPESFQTLPMFSACQVCCFPDGLRETQIDNPPCDARGPQSYHALACDICSGKMSLESYLKRKRNFLRDVMDCYKISNPI